jgi:hypothetical protein
MVCLHFLPHTHTHTHTIKLLYRFFFKLLNSYYDKEFDSLMWKRNDEKIIPLSITGVREKHFEISTIFIFRIGGSVLSM